VSKLLSWPVALALRSKFLLLVLFGLVLPLALIGLWLTRTLQRSGEELLQSQLAATLTPIAEEAQRRWIHRQSDLLLLASNEPIQRALQSNAEGLPPADAQQYLEELFADLADAIAVVIFRDSQQRARWVLAVDPGGEPRLEVTQTFTATLSEMAGLPYEVAVQDAQGRLIGSMEARIRLGSVFPEIDKPLPIPGAMLAVVDPRNGQALNPFVQDRPVSGRFINNGEPWLMLRHDVTSPPAALAIAAPLQAFTAPFERSARRGVIAVFAVAFAGFILAALLTKRLTGSLERLARAADAVTRGELDARIESDGRDEVGRVAGAFNTMIASLRNTLKQLSERQALAAVGEFASTLSHEVRNPLTSIRLDLQRVQERLPDEPRLRDPLARALSGVERLNHIVTGSLRIARSGRIDAEPVDLHAAVEAAIHRAEPEFIAKAARLERGTREHDPLVLSGDAGALEQLFLNLLLNAAQASPPGGRADVRIERNDGMASVFIRDQGHGMSADEIARAFEPFYSTKREGTGLGLAIARRIARAHGGDVDLTSEPGTGTTVLIRIPINGTAKPAETSSTVVAAL
jgi:signal transduction histidine kinase